MSDDYDARLRAEIDKMRDELSYKTAFLNFRECYGRGHVASLVPLSRDVDMLIMWPRDLTPELCDRIEAWVTMQTRFTREWYEAEAAKKPPAADDTEPALSSAALLDSSVPNPEVNP